MIPGFWILHWAILRFRYNSNKLFGPKHNHLKVKINLKSNCGEIILTEKAGSSGYLRTGFITTPNQFKLVKITEGMPGPLLVELVDDNTQHSEC